MFPFLEKKYKQKELARDGISIGDVHNETGLKRFLICLLRGLMVFLACYGTVVGVIEAFGIPYNKVYVTGFILLVSLFMALLYLNKPIFYIGYFLLLIFFTWELVRYYYHANSGYQAIVNIIYEAYSDHFNLLSLREAHEFITDRYLTVTIAMMFISALLAILLNLTISGYMNLAETVLITFPFLEIAFYIEKRPPLYCMIMILACYICVGIQQASGHFKMQVKGRHSKEYLKVRRRKITHHRYQSTAHGSLLSLVASLAIAVVIGLAFYSSYYSKVPIQPINAIKQATDNYVKIFVQSGFTGLLDRYESVGGMNQGRLGGVSAIRPDFETDLKVTFAPYSYHTVYLKGFTGSYYNSNQWSEHTYLYTFPNQEELIALIPEEWNSSPSLANQQVYMEEYVINYYDAQFQPETDSFGKMEIENIDAIEAEFLPYYSDYTQVDIDGTIHYTPYLGHYDEAVTPFNLPEYYEAYVNQFCLQIPEELRPALEEYCVKQEFPGVVGSTFTEATVEPEDINAYRLEVAQAIYEHFVADFDYTMSPGTTPYRQDFVEYFLTTQKRGVCAHFAASGAMLLRSMGIPARYVEGYVIPLSLMSEGTPVDIDYDEWYQGPTQVTEEGVLTVEVTDAQAHAWVEIYLEGYGFVPFEMTPPDFQEETPINFNFGSLFDGLFDMELSMENMGTGENVDIDYERNELPLFAFSMQTSFTPFLIVLGVIAGIALLIPLGRYLLRLLKQKKLLREEKYADLVYEDYQVLCSKISKKVNITNPNPLPDELCTIIKNWIIFVDNHEEIDKLFIMVNKALYSPTPMTDEEYTEYKDMLKRLYTLMKNNK